MNYIEVLHQNYHMQGFSSNKNFMYWSFTDSLVKTTFAGTVKCQTEVHGGHLGDIDCYDGKIYASYLKFPAPGHVWDDWTGFKIYVFDENDLHILNIINLDICDYYKSIAGTPEDTRGFRAVDGVALGKEPGTGERKLFVACATLGEERFSNQIILQLDLDGKYEKEYHIPTKNTVFGIQNLDWDEKRGRFWFSTYGPEKPFQPKETLYSVNLANCEKFDKYIFATPYGFEAQPDGTFACSVQTGVNSNHGGYAYECDIDFFNSPKSDKELLDMMFENK